jgi:hypothetical protein
VNLNHALASNNAQLKFVQKDFALNAPKVLQQVASALFPKAWENTILAQKRTESALNRWSWTKPS